MQLHSSRFSVISRIMKRHTSPLTETHITAWARLVRTSQRILQSVDAALKQADLPTLPWYDLLLELKRAEPAGLRPFQLQSEMLIPQYNMSRLLDRVAKAGYIERVSCDEDGRGQIVKITTEGKALLRKMWPVYKGVPEREFAAKMDEASAERLARQLDW